MKKKPKQQIIKAGLSVWFFLSLACLSVDMDSVNSLWVPVGIVTNFCLSGYLLSKYMQPENKQL